MSSTARNYTIRGLDLNTAYSGTIEAYAFTDSATAHWEEYALPQGELLFQSKYSGQPFLYSFGTVALYVYMQKLYVWFTVLIHKALRSTLNTHCLAVITQGV